MAQPAMGRANKVKNRAPAPIQITAEQIVLEAAERVEPDVAEAPRQHITDEDELGAYRMRKRKEFEDQVRRQRQHVGNFTKYATWEESQGEFERARSIFERALDVDYKEVRVWLRYAEMEMKNKFINRARNVFDRAVTLLPRVDTFWFKYTYMEEMVGNLKGARAVFERWMDWEPADTAWLSYIGLETRAGEVTRARAIWERYCATQLSLTSYLRYAKWEEYKQGQRALARRVYERATEELPDDEKDQRLFIAFAKFEARCREFERARAVFKYALDTIAKEEAADLYKEFIAFEKQHGEKKGVEEVIVGKRRYQYEEAVAKDPRDYDAWFDYVRLEEAEGDTEKVRDVYERAIANIPPVAEKRYWRRYVYLWINYALFEELEARDMERTRAVYREALRVIPHTEFTFGKLWLMAAKFEVRQRNLPAARKILGRSLGKCPKQNVIRGYIDLELALGEVDRCRTLYSRFVEISPHNCAAWTAFAELEQSVGETARARAIYELAVGQSLLDMPERLWKAYIDFEAENGEVGRARDLYERLLDRTKHVKVWISYLRFEADTAGDAARARAVCKRATQFLKDVEASGEERAMLFEAWALFEQSLPDNDANVRDLLSKRPRRVRKERDVYDEDGNLTGKEEFFDYIFPEDEQGNVKLFSFMDKARAFMAGQKRKAAAMAEDDADDVGGGGDGGDGDAGAGAGASSGAAAGSGNGPGASPPAVDGAAARREGE